MPPSEGAYRWSRSSTIPVVVDKNPGFPVDEHQCTKRFTLSAFGEGGYRSLFVKRHYRCNGAASIGNDYLPVLGYTSYLLTGMEVKVPNAYPFHVHIVTQNRRRITLSCGYRTERQLYLLKPDYPLPPGTNVALLCEAALIGRERDV